MAELLPTLPRSADAGGSSTFAQALEIVRYCRQTRMIERRDSLKVPQECPPGHVVGIY